MAIQATISRRLSWILLHCWIALVAVARRRRFWESTRVGRRGVSYVNGVSSGGVFRRGPCRRATSSRRHAAVPLKQSVHGVQWIASAAEFGSCRRL
jgi:hypothetical protein